MRNFSNPDAVDRRHEDPRSSLPKLSQFDFHDALADLSGPTLVVFTSPGCGGCRHLRGVLLEVHRQHPDWQVFEVDAQRDQALGNEFEVFHLPTIFLFFAGQYHCQLEAEARVSAIVAATRAALQQPAEEAP